jgi:hypothetical protein
MAAAGAIIYIIVHNGDLVFSGSATLGGSYSGY